LLRPAVLLLTIVALLAGAAPASAAWQLDLSATDQERPAPLAVGASGTAEDAATIYVSTFPAGTTCAADAGAGHQPGSVADMQQSVPEGPFDVRLEASSGGSSVAAGDYVFCGYLVVSTITRAADTAGPIRYASPPCPSAAFTVTEAADRGQGSGQITLALPGAGDVSATGDDGGAFTGSPNDPSSSTIHPQVTGAARQNLDAGQAVTVTYTITFTRRSTTTCVRPDGTEGPNTSEQRTAAITFQPPPRPPVQQICASAFSVVRVAQPGPGRAAIAAVQVSGPGRVDIRTSDGIDTYQEIPGPTQGEVHLLPGEANAKTMSGGLRGRAGKPIPPVTFELTFTQRGCTAAATRTITHTFVPNSRKAIKLKLRRMSAKGLEGSFTCAGVLGPCRPSANITLRIPERDYFRLLKRHNIPGVFLGRAFQNKFDRAKETITLPISKGVLRVLRRVPRLPVVAEVGLGLLNGPGAADIPFSSSKPIKRKFTLVRGKLPKAVTVVVTNEGGPVVSGDGEDEGR
jgi:hypothetical protein